MSWNIQLQADGFKLKNIFLETNGINFIISVLIKIWFNWIVLLFYL